MPSKTNSRKPTSNTKTSTKKKPAGKKPSKSAAPKKPVKSEQKKNEVTAGIITCVTSLFVLIIMFQSSITGAKGFAIKSAVIGTFGSFGYLIPVIGFIIGLILILKKEAGIKWGQVTLWAIFVLCSVAFYHTFFLRKIFAMRVVDVDFVTTTFGSYIKSSYDYGVASGGGSAGALGALLSYWLLKNFSIFGAVFVPLVYILIVLIVKNRVLLGEFIRSTKDSIEMRIEERESRETPLEQMGKDVAPVDRSRRKMPDEEQSAPARAVNAPPQRSESLHVMKEGKQKLYVEDIKNAAGDFDDEAELNTDFLLRHNKQPLSSGGTGRYTVDENQWDYALEQEQSKKGSRTAGSKANAEPTIQIRMTDVDDYKKDVPARHAATDAEYKFPPLDLIAFSNNKQDASLRAECHANAMRLEETLASFRVDAKVINITCGPTVTRYEMRPAAGVRVAKINGLQKDLAMALAATSVRIEAPIPNKNAVGIEVPNRTRSIVGLRDILEGSKFKTATSPLTICVGKDITGRNIVADLAKMPHMLVAGATGSGKSVFINSLILSLIYKSSPSDVRFIMVDPKKVELNVYNGIPHLLIPVVTKASMAASALNWAVKEMMNRYDIFADSGVRNLESYNKLAKSTKGMNTMPRFVIIVDELADLMQVASAEVEDAIYRLAQLARAAGMHLVIATQRPDVKVITGTIKANIPCRVAFSVNQLVDSRTILDGSGAEHLLGNGDMLFKFTGKPIRLQGAFVDDKEVEKVCSFLKAEGVVYDNNVLEDVKKIEKQSQSDGGGGYDSSSSDEFDNLLPDAVKVIYDHEKASTSMVQRKLRVGYNRAARIMDDLERLGVVGEADGSKPREIMVSYGTAMQIVSENDDE